MPESPLYVCPGESSPISRSVHLARMAAFYPKCRDCALRRDTGQLPRRTVEQLAATVRRTPRASLVAEDGLRGEHVNELTRRRAELIAARFALRVWAERPFELRVDGESGRGVPASRGATAENRRDRWRPRIVVGRDERSSSPDIGSGVVSALRRMGCRVIDVHTVPRPVFWFAVDHLGANGGIHVTGAGSPAAWTGLDFIDTDGRPLVDPETLDGLDQPDLPVARPTRHGGGYRSFEAVVPYEAGLWRHFHALRPLHVVCGAASRMVRETLAHLFARLPCRLSFVGLPLRRRDVLDPADPDVRRVGIGVERTGADLGLLVDEDGQRTAFLDERGTPIAPRAINKLVIERIREDDPSAILLDDPYRSAAEVVAAIHDRDAVFATTADGRCWFREPLPTADAVLVLARVLAALSTGDASFSEVIARGMTARAAA